MPEESIEFRRMELEARERKEMRESQEKREIRRADLFKWVVMLVIGPLGDGVTAYQQSRLASQVSAKVDAVAVKADDAATAAKTATAVAVETKRDQGEKLSAIVGGVDASVKSWKAYQTKDPSDMNMAVEAVDKAAATVPPNP